MNITTIDQKLRRLHDDLQGDAITVDAKVIIPGWVFTFEPIGQRWFYENETGEIRGHGHTLESAMSFALMPLVKRPGDLMAAE